jgi:hypothetical protein
MVAMYSLKNSSRAFSMLPPLTGSSVQGGKRVLHGGTSAASGDLFVH